MPVNFNLTYTHALTVSWIISMWYWLTDEDPYQGDLFGEKAQIADLFARGLSTHLFSTGNPSHNDAIERLAQLGIKAHLKNEGQRIDLKTSKDFEAQAANAPKGRPLTIAFTFPDGKELSWPSLFQPSFLTKAA